MHLIESKSIKSTCICIIIMWIVLENTVNVDAENNNHNNDDLPNKYNLETYLTSLEKITNFAFSHSNSVDLNFELGVFLSSVNLGNVIESKREQLAENIVNRIQKLRAKNHAISQRFLNMARKLTSPDKDEQLNLKISALLLNNVRWHLQKFNTNLLNQTQFRSIQSLKETFGTWDTYRAKVHEIFDGLIPNISDACVASLSDNPVRKSSVSRCNVPTYCVDMLRNGSDIGYGISHRLLLMIMARYSRRCSFISQEEDVTFTDYLCSKMYTEAEFIAANEYKMHDIMMEQISLCALLGHAQFLRRSWLDDLLHFQTPYGCFSERIDYEYILDLPVFDDNKPWSIASSDQTALSGICNTHISAVAAGALSAAVRYIIETFY